MTATAPATQSTAPAAPKFAFGGTAPKSEEATKEAAAPAPKSDAEKPVVKFQFGASADNKEAPKFTFGEKPKETQKEAPKFTFGASTDAPKTTFTFGAKPDNAT